MRDSFFTMAANIQTRELAQNTIGLCQRVLNGSDQTRDLEVLPERFEKNNSLSERSLIESCDGGGPEREQVSEQHALGYINRIPDPDPAPQAGAVRSGLLVGKLN